MNKFYFFLDETGDHSLSFIDKNYPIFLLCGCLFSEGELQKLTGQINEFKIDFFKSSSAILHSREIRKCEGSFQILFDENIKKDFYLNEGKLAGYGLKMFP